MYLLFQEFCTLNDNLTICTDAVKYTYLTRYKCIFTKFMVCLHSRYVDYLGGNNTNYLCTSADASMETKKVKHFSSLFIPASYLCIYVYWLSIINKIMNESVSCKNCFEIIRGARNDVMSCLGVMILIMKIEDKTSINYFLYYMQTSVCV